MSKLFELICAGYILAVVTAKVRRARWRSNCDLSAHLGPSRHLESKGYRIVQHDGMMWAENLACPECGAKQITVAGTPACRILPGTYGVGCDTSSAGRVSCQACNGWTVRSSELIEILYPTPKEQDAYLGQHCRGAAPQTERFTVAHYDGKTELRKSTQEATEAVLPADFEPGVEVELCSIGAIDEPMAFEIAQGIPDDAYVAVPVTALGEPRVLGWHSQKPSRQEVACYDDLTAREGQQRRLEIERETREFRAQKLQDAGLLAG